MVVLLIISNWVVFADQQMEDPDGPDGEELKICSVEGGYRFIELPQDTNNPHANQTNQDLDINAIFIIRKPDGTIENIRGNYLINLEKTDCIECAVLSNFQDDITIEATQNLLTRIRELVSNGVCQLPITPPLCMIRKQEEEKYPWLSYVLTIGNSSNPIKLFSDEALTTVRNHLIGEGIVSNCQ